MFLSAQALSIEYGIDDRIAKFFVDREPPKDNLYWKDKLLYLRARPGYIFLPLITDLFFKSEIAIETLLGERFVSVLEQIGHYSAQQEFGMISYDEVELQCRTFVEPLVVNKNIFREVNNYFKGVDNQINSHCVPFKALHRGDVFLYSLCVLDISEIQFHNLVQTWFALISTLLVMDDSEDYLADMESGDENAFIESGSTREGFEQIENMVTKSLEHLKTINYSMAHALKKQIAQIKDKPGIKEYLNN